MDESLNSLLASQSSRAESAALVLRCQAAVLSHDSLTGCATALAVTLADWLQCDIVAIGMSEGRQMTLVGHAGASALDGRLELARTITSAMHECLDQQASVAWPVASASDFTIAIAQQLLAGPGAALSVPLRAGQRVLGALCLRRATAFDADERMRVEDAASFAAPVLALRADARHPWRSLARQQMARFGIGRRVLAGSLATILLLASLVPLPYRVSAPARLEGSVQRAIVAATEGYLLQSGVRAGDRVKQGQVLAELASQDLQLERRRRESELRQHENAYRAAQARNDRTQMVVSQSRADEAQAMLSLVDAQIERARIVAPFDGVVIKGDLSQTLGAPVQRGEVLMTLAPGDSFRLIVEADEADVAELAPGLKGRLVLSADAQQAHDIAVGRIAPVAVEADGRHFVEVEATLAAGAGSTPALRPGLRGVAKIDVGSRPLLWQLGHRALDWMRFALWSLGA